MIWSATVCDYGSIDGSRRGAIFGLGGFYLGPSRRRASRATGAGTGAAPGHDRYLRWRTHARVPKSRELRPSLVGGTFANLTKRV